MSLDQSGSFAQKDRFSHATTATLLIVHVQSALPAKKEAVGLRQLSPALPI
jgi:hypothetical protein